MKICPYCAEEIQDAAIKCKHCSEFLDGSRLPPSVPKSSLPWHFRTSVMVISLLSVGPLALPMIWWHPRLHVAWKAAITLVVLVVTWMVYQAFMSFFQMMEENLKMFQEGGLI